MALALALGASVAWGTSDYIAGRTGRTVAVLAIALVSHCVGLTLLTFLVLARGVPLDGGDTLFPAVAGGAFTAIGLVCLYKALALGPVTVTAPISATGAVVPVLVGAALGEPVGSWQLAGMACALAGVALAARPDGAGESVAGHGGPFLALMAAGALGGSFVFIDRAGGGDAVWTAMIVHVGALLVLASIAWVIQASVRVPGATVPAVAAIGVLGAMGHACFAWAASIGFVSIVAVLASLYPVATVALAKVIDHERVSQLQTLGAALALLGTVLIVAA